MMRQIFKSPNFQAVFERIKAKGGNVAPGPHLDRGGASAPIGGPFKGQVSAATRDAIARRGSVPMGSIMGASASMPMSSSAAPNAAAGHPGEMTRMQSLPGQRVGAMRGASAGVPQPRVTMGSVMSDMMRGKGVAGGGVPGSQVLGTGQGGAMVRLADDDGQEMDVPAAVAERLIARGARRVR